MSRRTRLFLIYCVAPQLTLIVLAIVGVLAKRPEVWIIPFLSALFLAGTALAIVVIDPLGRWPGRGILARLGRLLTFG